MARLVFLIICIGFVSVAARRTSAAETNPVPVVPPAASATQDTLNAYLRIQAQLHDTQLAIESNRLEAATTAQHSVEDVAARLQVLEQTIATQRSGEVEMAQKTQQLMLILAGVFGTIGLLVMVLMAYLQWRTVSRIVELSSLRPAEFVLGKGHVLPSLMTSASVEQSNAELFSVVDHLEKRILELKNATRPPLNETGSSAGREPNGAPNGSNARDDRVARLLVEGQSLLDANEPEKALECFELVLGLHPNHADALVKKGGVLENLGRIDEAVACYDRAIEANGEMTIAYLHKGGLFNRLARYDEALKCYEKALRTQEKKAPAEKVAT